LDGDCDKDRGGDRERGRRAPGGDCETDLEEVRGASRYGERDPDPDEGDKTDEDEDDDSDDEDKDDEDEDGDSADEEDEAYSFNKSTPAPPLAADASLLATDAPGCSSC
jgi:hypothetical protein